MVFFQNEWPTQNEWLTPYTKNTKNIYIFFFCIHESILSNKYSNCSFVVRNIFDNTFYFQFEVPCKPCLKHQVVYVFVPTFPPTLLFFIFLLSIFLNFCCKISATITTPSRTKFILLLKSNISMARFSRHVQFLES